MAQRTSAPRCREQLHHLRQGVLGLRHGHAAARNHDDLAGRLQHHGGFFRAAGLDLPVVVDAGAPARGAERDVERRAPEPRADHGRQAVPSRRHQAANRHHDGMAERQADHRRGEAGRGSRERDDRGLAVTTRRPADGRPHAQHQGGDAGHHGQTESRAPRSAGQRQSAGRRPTLVVQKSGHRHQRGRSSPRPREPRPEARPQPDVVSVADPPTTQKPDGDAHERQTWLDFDGLAQRTP